MATEIDFTNVKTIIRWGVGMTLIGATLVYLGVGSLALCVAPPVVVMVVFSFLALSASRPWKRHNSQGIALLNQGRMWVLPAGQP